MSLELDEHRLYLSDQARLGAFRKALAESVRPDDIVLDLGTGTGILGMLACEAGAARVYAVDSGPIAGVARAVVAANGLDGRMTVVREHSTVVRLPEPVSLILTDQIGNFGFNAGLFEYISDACTRLMAPGGRTIPCWIELWTAPVEHEVIRRNVAFWSQRPAGFDYGPAATIAQSTGYPVEIAAGQLLGPGAMTIRVEPPTSTGPLAGTAATTITRAGILDGVAGWFHAGLSPSVVLTNAPGAPGQIDRRQVVLPLKTPRPVQPGNRIEIRLRVIAPVSMVEWRVTATPSTGGPGWTERGSTFAGLLLSKEDTARTRPDWRPSLTARGHARQTVLALCDGRHALRDIEQEVLARHPDVLRSAEDAAVFVAEVVSAYRS